MAIEMYNFEKGENELISFDFETATIEQLLPYVGKKISSAQNLMRLYVKMGNTPLEAMERVLRILVETKRD